MPSFQQVQSDSLQGQDDVYYQVKNVRLPNTCINML